MAKLYTNQSSFVIARQMNMSKRITKKTGRRSSRLSRSSDRSVARQLQSTLLDRLGSMSGASAVEAVRENLADIPQNSLSTVARSLDRSYQSALNSYDGERALGYWQASTLVKEKLLESGSTPTGDMSTHFCLPTSEAAETYRKQELDDDNPSWSPARDRDSDVYELGLKQALGGLDIVSYIIMYESSDNKVSKHFAKPTSAESVLPSLVNDFQGSAPRTSGAATIVVTYSDSNDQRQEVSFYAKTTIPVMAVGLDGSLNTSVKMSKLDYHATNVLSLERT